MQIPAYFMSPKMEKKGKRIFCHISQIAYSGKSPSFLDERRGKKIKSRKFIPFFPHLTTTSMQEHTHMTLDNTRDKRGLTKDPGHLTHHFTIRTWPGKIIFCWISIRKSRLNIYGVKVGSRWLGSILLVELGIPFF